VPWDAAHVFYVWYDALINYVTAIGYGQDDERFVSWWPAVHHLLAKDIVRFHCVWWPAMCMAAGIDPPGHLVVHGWLLVGGERLSKTRIASAAGNSDKAGPLSLTEIAPEALTEDFGVDAVRYFLLRDTAFGADGDFSYEGITSRFNADLANNLGNLMARVATVVASKCKGVGPKPDPASRLQSVSAGAVVGAISAWNDAQPHLALEATWRLIHETNSELESAEPWKCEPGPVVDAVLGSALEVLRIVSVLTWPAMPEVCTEIWRRLGLPGSPDGCRVPADTAWGGYPGGLVVEKGAALFPRRAR
jgi:methionyl-tRNA synthetase